MDRYNAAELFMRVLRMSDKEYRERCKILTNAELEVYIALQDKMIDYSDNSETMKRLRTKQTILRQETMRRHQN